MPDDMSQKAVSFPASILFLNFNFMHGERYYGFCFGDWIYCYLRPCIFNECEIKDKCLPATGSYFNRNILCVYEWIPKKLIDIWTIADENGSP